MPTFHAVKIARDVNILAQGIYDLATGQWDTGMVVIPQSTPLEESRAVLCALIEKINAAIEQRDGTPQRAPDTIEATPEPAENIEEAEPSTP